VRRRGEGRGKRREEGGEKREGRGEERERGCWWSRRSGDCPAIPNLPAAF